MKKVLLVLLFITFGVFIYTSIALVNSKEKNNLLQKEINMISNHNKKMKEDNLNYEQDIAKLREERKEKWEELNIWKETEEKIKIALSQ